MTFKNWYNFNKQIRVFCLGEVYVKIMRKKSFNKEDEVGTVKMSLENIALHFGDYEIIYINKHVGPDEERGIDLGMYKPNLVNLK